MRIARSKGVEGFTADVFAHNHAMLKVFHKSGCEMKSSHAASVCHLELLFAQERRPSESTLREEERTVGA
jgi:hypothetical protein